MGTHDFFKALHFVNCIVMETGFAEIHFMIAVADIHLHAFFTVFFYRPFAYFTRLDVSDTVNHFLHLPFDG